MNKQQDINKEIFTDVVKSIKEVNSNFNSIMKIIEKLIARQQIMIGLCIVVLLQLVCIFVTFYTIQRTQENVNRHMELIVYHMQDIKNVQTVLGSELSLLKDSIKNVEEK